MAMEKQLSSAFILLLIIICLLSSTMSTGKSPANEGKRVRQSEHVRLNSEPVLPNIIQNLEHNSVQAAERPKLDGKALYVPEAPQNAKAQLQDHATWCIVKPPTGDELLNANIQFCCNQKEVDCRIIQPGGQCYEPNNNYSHASVVMNLYYKANNKYPHTCDFMHSGLIISQDPSVGKCIYEA